MDGLVGAVMRHAPEFMHRVYALEGIPEPRSLTELGRTQLLTCRTGANEILLDLKNEESKVAYLIHITATVLDKASSAIDPMVRADGQA